MLQPQGGTGMVRRIGSHYLRGLQARSGCGSPLGRATVWSALASLVMVYGACTTAPEDRVIYDMFLLGYVRGRVITGDGAPVPDVEVHIRYWGWWACYENGIRPDIYPDTTDADGRFEFGVGWNNTPFFDACVSLVAFPPATSGLAIDSVSDIYVPLAYVITDTVDVEIVLPPLERGALLASERIIHITGR